MLRFLFRFAGMVALAVSVIMAVLDVTRTVAASAIVVTPLKTSWNAVSPETLGVAEAFVREKVAPLAWDTVANWVLNQPGFAVFAVLAFLLYALGYRPRRRAGRHTAA